MNAAARLYDGDTEAKLGYGEVKKRMADWPSKDVRH